MSCFFYLGTLNYMYSKVSAHRLYARNSRAAPACGAVSPTTAARTSAHHNRFGQELPWHHVRDPSPNDGPTHHIDLCKSPQTPTFAHSQMLARFYMNGLLRPGARKNRPRFESGAYLGFGGTRSNHYQSRVHLLGNVVKPGSTSVPELSRWVPAPAGPLPFGAWFKT